jgi:hypothetical protein
MLYNNNPDAQYLIANGGIPFKLREQRGHPSRRRQPGPRQY